MSEQKETTPKRWHAKLVSDVTVLILGAGLIAGVLSFVEIPPQTFQNLPESAVMVLSDPVPLRIVAVACGVLALVSEAVSRLRTPPPTWRVKQELIRSLGQLNLLDINDQERWRGMFSVAPIGRWNHKTKSFTLPFLLRHTDATEKTFADLEQSIAGFARSRDASIEIENSNRIYNMRLVLWYTENPYKAEEINPWR